MTLFCEGLTVFLEEMVIFSEGMMVFSEVIRSICEKEKPPANRRFVRGAFSKNRTEEENKRRETGAVLRPAGAGIQFFTGKP